MTRSICGLAAVVVSLSFAAAASAGPANVTVRVEGQARTLVPEVRVATDASAVSKSGKPGESCSGTSVAGALEKATAGDWGGSWSADFDTYFVDTIKGEKHGGDPDYWTFWVNHKAATQGICQVELQEGDDVLFFLDYCDFDPNTFACRNEPVLPLDLRVPASARRGDTVTGTVVRYEASGEAKPIAGARVTGPGYDATTGPDGTLRIFLPSAGELRFRAERSNAARSATEVICVSEGTDGSCGTPDRRPPLGRIDGIPEGWRYDLRRGPRELRGTVGPDVSGLREVKLRLTRRVPGPRCSYFSGRRERFRPARCGFGRYFRIGDRADWSYLLPARLPAGRYALDVVAIDKAGNRDPLHRGRNRKVFWVG